MSWEFTIICDACGRLIAAGSTKRLALRDLRQTGGRRAGDGWPDGKHLCGACRP